MEVDSWNSAELGIFSELLYTFAEFEWKIPQNFAEYLGFLGNNQHGIPEEIKVVHRK
jgi:hypothetical protein